MVTLYLGNLEFLPRFRDVLALTKLQIQGLMANTTALSKDERKKAKRTARKKRKTQHPLKPREYARGSQKRKVKKMARGQAKR